MASNIVKTPLIRAVNTRCYSKVVPVGGVCNYDLKTSTASNRITVATADNESPIARVSIIFRAGSRYETDENVGVTHVLRTAAGLTTKNASQFAITRNIQQLGARLTATSDRETVSYTLEGTRQAVEKLIPYLAEVASQQTFAPWEISDLSDRLKLDLATRPLQLRAVDLFHKAAFRRGLGNSLFVPKFQIGRISTETLQHYVSTNFTGGRTAVIGLGLDHSTANELAQSLNVGTGEGSSGASSYKGGEVRSDKGGDFAFVAIGGEGAGAKNPQEALAVSVLQKAFCSGPQIKWTANDNGVLNRSISKAAGTEYTSAGINAIYSDTGLFGVLLAVPSKNAASLVESAVKCLKSASVTDEDVNRGKNLLKTEILMECGGTAVRRIGSQAVLTGSTASRSSLADAVDSVTKDDVSKALSKVSAKLSIASVGNLSKVPYLDEIN